VTLPADSREIRRNRLILIALWLLFYCSFTLFSPPLLDDADSVHAEVAREMLLRHDFVTLYANGIRYLEKAPLYYWSMAASMHVFGATTAASRLPLAFAVLALALLLEAFARRAFASRRAGLYAGLITLSSFGIFIFSRINIPDVLVCVLLATALFAYALSEGQATPSRSFCLAFAAACALNILTKGLIGIVFPVGIVGLHLLLTRGFRGAWTRIRQLHPIASLATFLIIAVPWHILIAIANPGHGQPGGLAKINGHWQVPYPTDGNVHGWAWFYFINEQLYRYLNIRVPHDYDTSPLWLFLGLIFIWLMPWSAFLPSAIGRAARSLRFSRLRTLAPIESINLLLILWLSLPLAFFTFSTRQEYYVLPALPPMILLIAALLAESSHPVLSLFTRKPTQRIATGLLILGTLVSIATIVFLLKTKPPAPNTDLAALLQQNPADYALSFGHFLDLNAQALGLFRLPLALTAIAFFLGPLAHWMLRRRNQPHAATLALAAASFVFLLAAWQGLRIFSPTLTSAQLADAIRPQLRPQDLIAIHGEYEAGSTLGFYLGRNDIHIIEGRSSNLGYGSFFPDAPPIFETRDSIASKWLGPQRIFLWQDPHDAERPVLQLPQPVYVIGESGGKQILSNQTAN
jgi:4-amino-4-deoxy-L-arabinose transferase-like glycosyltransferase